MTPLTEEQKSILAFAGTTWQSEDLRGATIRELFGMSPGRFTQHLLNIIDNPAALALDPVLVARLRRLRDQRREARSARRLLMWQIQ